MYRIKYFKKFLLSGSVYAATVVSSSADEGKSDDQSTQSTKSGSGECDPCTGKLVRRSDLPLYDDYPQEGSKQTEDEPCQLEQSISNVRKEVWVWHDKYEGYREKIVDAYNTGKEHATVLVERLREDDLPIPRPGAVAIGGVTGVVLGLRGGWFKRIFYGSTCAGLVAALCYPQEASVITQEAIQTTKKYVQITYNFIYGEKAQDESPVSVQKQPPPSSERLPPCPPKQEDPVGCAKRPVAPPPQTDVPGCTCTCHCRLRDPSTPACPLHGPAENEQGPKQLAASFCAPFDNFADESADVVYWGFRLH